MVSRRILLLLVLAFHESSHSLSLDCEAVKGKELHWRIDNMNCSGYNSLDGVRRCKQVQHALLGDGSTISIKNVNQPEPRNNWTALMLASYAGHNHLVKRLLDRGADPNMKDWCGWTALMFAAFSASSTCVIQHLLEHGADINAVKYHEHSALFIASSYKNIAVVEMLLEHNANFRQRDAWGKAPISAGVYNYPSRQCVPDLVKVYLKFCQTRTGSHGIYQALWAAIDHCCPTIVRDLLNSGVRIFDLSMMLSYSENKTKVSRHLRWRHSNCSNCDCEAAFDILRRYNSDRIVSKPKCLNTEDITIKNHCDSWKGVHPVFYIFILVAVLLLALHKYMFRFTSFVLRRQTFQHLPETPPPPSPALSPPLYSPSPLKLDTSLRKVNLPQIKVYLQGLRKQDVVNVGTSLGLDYAALLDLPASAADTTMLCWWIEQRHHVMELSGVPTLMSLVEALKSQGLNGPIARIYNDCQ